jgi:dTDP-4-amino-4,6-dideoxygalactose transaminase
MSLHGLSRDAWKRFTSEGSWYYEITAPGFKYNLTDLAAAIGVVQLSRAETLQASRQRAAEYYLRKLTGLPLDCPAAAPPGGLHAWHMFPIRLHQNARASRDDLIADLAAERIGTSVHYRPLHEMTYWKERYRCEQSEFPVASRYFEGAVTLPLFPGMTDAEVDRVVSAVQAILR